MVSQLSRVFSGLRRFVAVLLVVLAAAGGFWCGAAHAAVDEDWASKPFHYVAVDQNLRDVLRELSIAAAVPVKVSDLVSGQAHGRWPDTTMGELLGQLARTYALEWYFDGSLLSVSASSEDETRLVSLHGAGLEKLRAGLTAAGLLDARFTLRAGPAPDVALVSGPPRYLAVVQETLDAIVASGSVPKAMQSGSAVASTERRIMVFRGSTVTNVVLR